MNEINLSLGQLLDEVEMLSQARVVSGFDNLDRPVHWPQIADIPSMTDWLRNSELLLTTSFALQEPTGLQHNLIHTLADKGIAGMIVSVGRFIDHVPPSACAAADAVGLPIIELPHQISLLEVAKQISQHLIAQRTELLNYTIKIHQTLTQLALQNSNLDMLAQALAQILKRPVIIDDTSLRPLAHARFGAESVESADQLKTPKPLADHLQQSGILTELRRSPRPTRVGIMPDGSTKIERIIAPVMAGEEELGYVWVVANERPLAHLDYIAIEHAATVIALIITREQAVQQAARQRYGDLVDMLLTEGVVLTDKLLTESRQLGLDPNTQHRVLLLLGADPVAQRLQSLKDALQQAFDQMGKHPLLTSKRERLIMIVSEPDVAIVQNVLEQLCEGEPGFVAGMGNVAVSLEYLYRSYQEAVEAAQVGTVFQLHAPIVHFDQLGLLHWLYHLPEEFRTGNLYLAKIQSLANHDHEAQGELLHTLEIYLAQGANASATAKSLHLHRSTLLYRLEKCQTICQSDLTCPQERLNLYVASKAWRLFSYNL